MNPRAGKPYFVFFGLVVLIAAVGYLAGRPRPSSGGVLAAVPRDAWLVVTADVAALRQSPLAEPLLGGGTAVPGLGPLAASCGFDPVARLRDVALASPEGGERGDFGVAFTGDFQKEELAACADKVIRARGGRPATSTRDGFTLVDDAGDAQHARLAYRDGGPFLVGRGAWLDAMIDAVGGKTDRARAEHATLRDALAARDGHPRAVLLTALLPKDLREKLKGELAAEQGGAPNEGDRAYAAVLAVQSAGVALSTGPAGSTTELAAELRCETDSACAEVKTLIERKRLAFSQQIGIRLIGLGPLLDSLTVEVHGAALTVRAQAPTSDLARAIQRVMAYRAPAPTGDAGTH